MALPPTLRVMAPAPNSPNNKPVKVDSDLVRWLKNRWWTFKTRCKRLKDGDIAFISERYYYYQPCKVCGSIMCKWASLDKTRRPV